MPSNFRYTLLSCVRNPALLFWPLAFPIILSTLFSFMFAHIDESYELQPVSVGIVRDASWEAAVGLDETLQAVDDTAAGDVHVVDLTDYANAQEAAQAVRDGEVACFVTADADGMPQLHLAPSDLTEESRLHLSAVVAILDGYVRTVHEMADIAEADPTAFAEMTPWRQESAQMRAGGSSPDLTAVADAAKAAGAPDVLARFVNGAVGTTRLKLTRTEPDPSARYYYALLGMAACLGATLTCEVIRSLQADVGALGARRTLAGIARWRLLTSSLAASWLTALACLVIGFAFMRHVLGVDFGDRALPCLVAMAVASLAFCALGALFGTFSRVSSFVLTAISTLLSFFAGLYGTASQRVADGIAATYPALAAANPVRQTAQLFYSLLYYDSLDPFWGICGTLVAMAAAFALVAGLRMRRQRYAHL